MVDLSLEHILDSMSGAIRTTTINGECWNYNIGEKLLSERKLVVQSFSHKLDGNNIELNLSFKNSTQYKIILPDAAHEFLRRFILILIRITAFKSKLGDLEKKLISISPRVENGYRRYAIFDEPMKLEFDGRMMTLELTTLFGVRSWKILVG